VISLVADLIFGSRWHDFVENSRFCLASNSGSSLLDPVGKIRRCVERELIRKPSATFEYNVINAATNKAVIHTVESTDQMGNIGDQVTLEKPLSASSLDPGVYRIQIKVNDNISKQTVDPSATFAVE
jgi:hypothetical protein